MIAPLRRVIVRAPDAAFGAADPERWHYSSRPDLSGAAAEHAALVQLLAESGAEILRHEEPLEDRADAVFVHDPVLVTDRGAILLRMGKPLRSGEEEALGRTLKRAGVPICFRLSGEARAEAGDCLWLDQHTLAVGLGFRTNLAGLTQLRQALDPAIEVISVPLPCFTGPEACLHLMSLISLVDHDLAVVYPSLLPVPFWQQLQARKMELIEVPRGEFASLGSNVLTLAPRRCVMLAGNPVTQRALEAAGADVRTYAGEELSLKAEGGPTCLTRPVLRG